MAHPSVTGAEDSGRFDYASFAVDRLRECAVVVASGEIDLCTSPGLRRALGEAVRHSQRTIVDLTGVTFLDSTGMGVLVEALKTGGDRPPLCLVGPAGLVRRALDIAELSRLFPVYDSVDEAVEAVP